MSETGIEVYNSMYKKELKHFKKRLTTLDEIYSLTKAYDNSDDKTCAEAIELVREWTVSEFYERMKATSAILCHDLNLLTKEEVASLWDALKKELKEIY